MGCNCGASADTAYEVTIRTTEENGAVHTDVIIVDTLLEANSLIVSNPNATYRQVVGVEARALRTARDQRTANPAA